MNYKEIFSIISRSFNCVLEYLKSKLHFKNKLVIQEFSMNYTSDEYSFDLLMQNLSEFKRWLEEKKNEAETEDNIYLNWKLKDVVCLVENLTDELNVLFLDLFYY